MATVRFSKELKDAIVANARNKMQPTVHKMREQKPDQAWGQRIYDILFGVEAISVRQLPAYWFSTADKISIASVNNVQCGLSFELSTPMPWPTTFPATPLARRENHYSDDITLLNHEVWNEFTQEVVAYRQRISAAVNRQNEFVEMVKKVIVAYGTLAPALKAWPPLWDLIPEEAKNRHREIKEREKREVTLEVDLDKLTSLSTAARLGVI